MSLTFVCVVLSVVVILFLPRHFFGGLVAWAREDLRMWREYAEARSSLSDRMCFPMTPIVAIRKSKDVFILVGLKANILAMSLIHTDASRFGL